MPPGEPSVVEGARTESSNVSVLALYDTGCNFQKQFSSTLPDLHLWEI